MRTYFVVMSRRMTCLIVAGMMLGLCSGIYFGFSDYTGLYFKKELPTREEPEESHAQGPMGSNHTTFPSITSSTSKETKPEVKKVLLLTYMRGGSSLLGELFNQNEAASYWFEPVDGMYSDMYGTSHGWFPIDIQFNTGGIPRYIDHEEENHVVNSIKDIYNCNIAALPVDVLSNYQLMHIKQRRNKNYIDCVNNKMAESHTRHPWGCKSGLRNYCPRHFDPGNSSLATCAYIIDKYKATLMADVYKVNVQIPKHLSSKSNFTENNSARLFGFHRECIGKSKAVVDQYCTPDLQNVCESSNIIAIKAIRLRADTVFRLMQEIPNLHVVYYVRDPRGVVASRSNTKLISETAKRLPGFNDPLVNEAKLLCQRMSTDHSLMTKLDSLFPGQVMTLRYEDFVTNVESVAEKMYKSFLNQTVPQSLTKWFSGAPSGKNSTKTGSGPIETYGTHRKDPSATASKWKYKLTLKQLSAINTLCDDVLRALGYE